MAKRTTTTPVSSPAPDSVSLRLLNGSSDDDLLRGDGVARGRNRNTAETFDAGAGADTILAGGGADTIIGGTGDDSIDGMWGSDRAVYADGADAVTFAWNGGVLTVATASEGVDTLRNVEFVQFGTKVYSTATGMVARSDSEVGTENLLEIDVLANDASFQSGALTLLNTAGQAALVGDVIATVAGAAGTPVSIVYLGGGKVGFAEGEIGFDGLAADETRDISFVYSVANASGSIDTATVTAVIQGIDDAAKLTAQAVSAQETDTPLEVSGAIDWSDVDGFAGFEPHTIEGPDGSLSVDANGGWVFRAASAFDALAAGEVMQVSFLVTARDGAQAAVTIEVVGTEEIAPPVPPTPEDPLPPSDPPAEPPAPPSLVSLTTSAAGYVAGTDYADGSYSDFGGLVVHFADTPLAATTGATALQVVQEWENVDLRYTGYGIPSDDNYSYDRRSFGQVELDLSGVQTGSVTAASLDVGAMTVSLSGYGLTGPLPSTVDVGIYAQAGNGVIEADDLLAEWVLVGSIQDVPNTGAAGSQTVALDAALIDAIIAGGATHLSLSFRADVPNLVHYDPVQEVENSKQSLTIGIDTAAIGVDLLFG